MKKMFFLGLFCLVAFCNAAMAESIIGFWKKNNEKTDLPECMIAVYEYKDVYYGRIVATYDEKGKMDDTIYAPKQRAPGIKGQPFYCGLDFIWGLRLDDTRYKGKIIDPREGEDYKAEVWVKNGNLIVRGKLLVFGRNTVWFPVKDSDFSDDFKKPDTRKFVPKIPQGI